jgi:shikimate kinase
MRKIFLIGYMGAGKTTIGKRLSEKLDLQFIDMDLFIENRYRKKISEIFAEKGEEGFREIEKNTLQEVAQFENVVISTGGGAPCFFDNMEVMNRSGQTIYLKVSVDELAMRLIKSKNSRPLIQSKNWEEVKKYIAENLAKRETWYNQASVIFNVEKIATHQDINYMVESLSSQIIQMQKQ